jgi:hypothetical protein
VLSARERAGRGADWKWARGPPFIGPRGEGRGPNEVVVRSSVANGHYGSVDRSRWGGGYVRGGGSGASAHWRIDGELGGGRGRAGEAGEEWQCDWPWWRRVVGDDERYGKGMTCGAEVSVSERGGERWAGGRLFGPSWVGLAAGRSRAEKRTREGSGRVGGPR